MDLKTCLESRRTIHKFKNEKVNPELIDEALRLANFAPNHKLTQPVRYIKTSLETREKLFKIAVEMKEARAPLSSEKKKIMGQKYLEASDLLIITRIQNKNPMIAKEDYATLAMAIQNISLFLWEKGVGTKWSSGGILDNPKTYETLRINPNEETLEAFLWIGMAEVVPPPIPRKDVKEFIRTI